MRVLLLAWGVDVDGPTVPTSARGLAGALARAGHDVVLVTRLGADATPPVVDGVEVHAVSDAPPIVPPEMDDEVLRALAFAGRATSVAVRRMQDAAVDVVHAEGWQTGPVVAALQHSHGVPVVAVLEPWELDGDGPAAETAAALASSADVVVQRSPGAATERVLPVGVDLPARTPGPPPDRGPLHLTAAPGEVHREVAGVLRAGLGTARRITRSWSRRPFAAVVRDARDLRAVASAWAAGVPVVTVAGPAGDLVGGAGGGLVVPESPASMAAAVDDLGRDPSTAAGLAAAGWAAAQEHGWSRTVAVWETAASAARERTGRPHLHAAG